jgi:hypothetical protein
VSRTHRTNRIRPEEVTYMCAPLKEIISILALLKSLELPKKQKSFEDDWKAKVNSNSSYGTAKHSPHPDQTACRGLETVSLCTVRRS